MQRKFNGKIMFFTNSARTITYRLKNNVVGPLYPSYSNLAQNGITDLNVRGKLLGKTLNLCDLGLGNHILDMIAKAPIRKKNSFQKN